MKTICFYSVATHLGGGERSLMELVKGLQRHPELGYSPWVLLPQSQGPLLEHLESSQIQYDILPIPRSFFEISRGMPLSAFWMSVRSIPGMSFYLARLALLLRNKQPQLIHTNGIKCHGLAALVGPVIGTPVLWHLRDILVEGPTLWTLRALSRGSRVHMVANSKATADAFLKKGKKITVVYNGLNAGVYFRNPNRMFHQEFHLNPKIPLVGILGVLALWKGQMEFIRMAARLIQRGSSAHFVVIGDEIYDTQGEDQVYRQILQNEVKLLQISDRVHFVGFRENPAEAINGLDLLVHASVKPEPFGRVILEAMACGVPVIASAAGGVLEFVTDQETGLLFPSGDVEAMVQAAERLLMNQELRQRVTTQGEALFLSRFTQDRYVEAMAEVYRQCLKR